MALTGIHHLALSTNDMKSQIEFYTQVVGMELAALFPMHGVDGASHCFIKAGDECYLSFVEMAGVKVEPVLGVSHARDAADAVAGGAMQHVSFKVDSIGELLDMRDRLRTHGYAALGPLPHDMSYSLYAGAPEGVLLEFSTVDTCEPLVPAKWVDPATGAALGMSKDDLARYVSPPPFAPRSGAVSQPDPETSVYPTAIPREMFAALGHLDDQALKAALEFGAPKVDAAA